MSLNADLYTQLNAHVNLSALVDERIYPMRLPQNSTLPAVVYTKISEERVLTLSKDTDGPRKTRMQLTSYGDTLISAEAAAEEVRMAMESNSVGTFRATHAFETTSIDPDEDVYAVIADYSIYYTG